MKKILIAAAALFLSGAAAFGQASIFNATYPLAKYQNGFRTINGQQLNKIVDEVNSLTGFSGTSNPLNAVTGTTGNFTGAVTISGTLTAATTNQTGPETVTSASANALSVGLTGATNPAFNVDASTASQVAGLDIIGAIHNGTVAVVVTDSSGATNLTINALSTGTIGIGSVSTGRVTITPVTTITGALTLGGLASDTGQTATATVCEDTTTHVTYFGSGAAGICKGTSSRRFKHDIEDLKVGLNEILGLRPTSYYLNPDRGDPTKKIYGFIAEESVKPLPELVGYDSDGRITSFDLVGVVPVLVKAVQELQNEIDALKYRGSMINYDNLSKCINTTCTTTVLTGN